MENIAEVPFNQIDLAFWNYHAINPAFSDRVSILVYILTFSVLNIHGRFGMLWINVFINHSADVFGGGLYLNLETFALWMIFSCGVFVFVLFCFKWWRPFQLSLSKWKQIVKHFSNVNVKNFSIISYLTDWKIGIFLTHVYVPLVLIEELVFKLIIYKVETSKSLFI